MTGSPGGNGEAALALLRAALGSQYHAALAMLREVVERYPEERWEADRRVNAPWQLAYHSLFFTHLYLQPEVAAFRPWKGHRSQVQHGRDRGTGRSRQRPASDPRPVHEGPGSRVSRVLRRVG